MIRRITFGDLEPGEAFVCDEDGKLWVKNEDYCSATQIRTQRDQVPVRSNFNDLDTVQLPSD